MAKKGKFGTIKGMWDKVLKHLAGEPDQGEQELEVVDEDKEATGYKMMSRKEKVGNLGSPPIFYGNSKQRRKAKRQWEKKNKQQK